MKYYEIILNGYDKIGGMLYCPEKWPTPTALDGEEVKNWQSLVVELKDGEYCPFHVCVGHANMVNEELKELLETFVDSSSGIEFLPVRAISEEYGDRTYYIMHFTKIFDVIDTEKTVYIPITHDILKVRLDYEKVKDLKVFNTRPIIGDVIISEDVYKAMKKKHLGLGIIFQRVYCGKDI